MLNNLFIFLWRMLRPSKGSSYLLAVYQARKKLPAKTSRNCPLLQKSPDAPWAWCKYTPSLSVAPSLAKLARYSYTTAEAIGIVVTKWLVQASHVHYLLVYLAHESLENADILYLSLGDESGFAYILFPLFRCPLAFRGRGREQRLVSEGTTV